MAPGAVGIDYNAEQEGNKLIGTSTGEKKDLLRKFNEDFKEFFVENKKIEEEEAAAEEAEEATNTQVVTNPTSTSTSPH